MVSVTYRLITELKPNSRNARIHSKKQIEQIAASIKEFGFLNPPLLDPDDVIVAGHGRVEAAKLLGLTEVPTIRVDHLSEAQRRAYVIADNNLALKAGWDPEILAAELQYLSDVEVDFDVEITGFGTPDIDLLLDPPSTRSKNGLLEDQVLPLGRTPISSLGDVWLLGDHKVICGDARFEETYRTLMGENRARVVFADPPYNVPIDGHVCGRGQTKHREFAMASGEMTGQEFAQFLTDIFVQTAAYSVGGAIAFICMDWRHITEILTAGRAAYTELKNLCVWSKDNGGLGSFYRSQHELIFVFKSGTSPHINNIELGKHGRYRTNVWAYPGVNTQRPGRLADLQSHPTVKPTALVMDAIKDCSKRGDVVLDPCGGSGTTLIAAEKTRRKACLIELDPLYVDVTIRRWQRLTGAQAKHAVTGASFAACGHPPGDQDQVSGGEDEKTA